MSLAMDPEGNPRRELIGTVVGQLDEGRARLEELLEHPGEVDREKTVHSARKRCKEARGLAQLARPAIGKDYKKFNALVRDAASELSALRDAHALLGTVDTLRSIQPDTALDTVHDELIVAAAHTEGTVLDAPHILRKALGRLTEARDLAAAWKLRKGFGSLAEGLGATYTSGRTSLRAARKVGDDEAFHNYRKTTKKLWYQTRFLRPTAPTVLQPLVDQLDLISDALGDDHDLAVLVEQLTADPGRFGGSEVVAAACAVIAVHRVILQERALRAGETLYVETPRAFTTRLTAYWRATQRRGLERPLGGIAALHEEATLSEEAAVDETETHFEIERKWLVRELPDPLPAGTRLRQGYLASTAELSLRVRDASEKGCTVTIKSGSGATRTELEWPIEREVFERLWPLTGDQRVSKTRYRLPAGEHTIELDVFDDSLGGFVVAEVEFTSEDAMAAYVAPGWFGNDVTDDGRYTNASLARNGLPDAG